MHYTITVLGTGSIQPYNFGSNLLRENIGGSELVARATKRWVQEILDETVQPEGHNFTVDKTKLSVKYDVDKVIETGLPAEVVYAGGGNTVILFADKDKAKTFVYTWSRKVLEEAPGLEVYAVHADYEWGGQTGLAQAISDAMAELGRMRGRLPASQASLGLSVSAACSSTGLPANQRHPSEDRQERLTNIANRQVQAKWDAAARARNRLRGIFEDVTADFEWSDDLEKIGRLPGRDDSYVAVVHADGNGMGKRVMLLGDMFARLPEYPRAFIQAMRALSLALNGTAETAMKGVVGALVAALQKSETDDNPLFFADGKEKILPFRPIVFGGDDVTWVCAGPFGLSLAHRYLVELEKVTLPSFAELLENKGIPAAKAAAILADFADRTPKSDKPYACAGVALVKTHYPFAQAYQISEELAGAAKSRVHALRPDKLASAIDWHYTTTGLTAVLDEIRRREYTTLGGEKLHARPLMLDSAYTWRNWDSFTVMWQAFSGWFDQRNKMMALREAVRGGPPAVAQFAATERVGGDLPRPILQPPTEGALSEGGKPDVAFKDGWVRLESDQADGLWAAEERGAYFDAIEIEKLYLPLTV